MTHPTHRNGACRRCEGTGRDFYACDCDPDNGTCAACPACPDCDGHGKLEWRWEPDTTNGECYYCHAEKVDTMPSGEDGDEPACLACMTRWHTQQCGCDLWPAPKDN
jgi:hypothetical protein